MMSSLVAHKQGNVDASLSARANIAQDHKHCDSGRSSAGKEDMVDKSLKKSKKKQSCSKTVLMLHKENPRLPRSTELTKQFGIEPTDNLRAILEKEVDLDQIEKEEFKKKNEPILFKSMTISKFFVEKKALISQIKVKENIERYKKLLPSP